MEGKSTYRFRWKNVSKRHMFFFLLKNFRQSAIRTRGAVAGETFNADVNEPQSPSHSDENANDIRQQ